MALYTSLILVLASKKSTILAFESSHCWYRLSRKLPHSSELVVLVVHALDSVSDFTLKPLSRRNSSNKHTQKSCDQISPTLFWNSRSWESMIWYISILWILQHPRHLCE